MNRARLSTLSLAGLLAAFAGQADAQCIVPDKLIASDPATDAYLGGALALDGQYLLAGASNRATAAGTGAGKVYPYFPVNGVWQQGTAFTPQFGVADERFGGAVGLGGSAEWAVVGAWGVNSGAGKAYFFRRDLITGQWSEVSNFTPGFNANARFGQELAMNKTGTIAAVSAPYATVIDGAGTTIECGRVVVYTRNPNNTWSIQTDLHQASGSIRQTNDFYGMGVAADGSTVVVGACGADHAGMTNCGYIHIWNRDANNVWTNGGEVYAPDAEAQDYFGVGVAIRGNTMAVGADGVPSGNVNWVGAVYLYRLINGVWTFDGKVQPSDPVQGQSFGGSLVVDGDNLIAGSTNGAGKAYHFKRQGPGQWVQAGRYVAPSFDPEFFGRSLVLEGNLFFAGASEHTEGAATRAGAAYRMDLTTIGNDMCEGATPVTQGTYQGCNKNSTTDGSANCGNNVGSDVWFRYLAPATGSLTIDTLGSGLDTVLSVHNGCPGTTANAIACNDDFAAPERWSRVTVPVQQGATYRIRVAGYGNSTGGFTLNIGSVSGSCYANCDASTAAPVLNVQDFSCFLNKFANSDPYANCDGSVLPPVLNVQDFSCFLNKFSAGCS